MSAWLLLGLALPLAVAVGTWLHVQRRRRVAAALGDPRLLPSLAPGLATVPRRRLALILGAAGALGVALTDPRWGDPTDPRAAAAGSVVLVLDASNSMLARDAQPTRLASERAAARTIVRSLGGSAIGVVVFAGRAYALSPPTADAGAVELYLDALDPEMVSQTGTAFTGAIRQGIGMLLGGSGPGGGALVLITDGDADEPLEAVEEVARLARRAGVRVYALGVGNEAGSTVPDVDYATGRVVGVKRTPDGEPAISRLRPEPLRRVAEVSGGAYAEVAEPAAAAEVVRRIREDVSGGAAEGRGIEAPARYGWFVGLALALLVLEGAAGRLASRRAAVALAMLLVSVVGCETSDPAAAAARGDLAAAAIGYERALAAHPGDPVAQYGLGTVRLLQERYEDSRPHLEAARGARDDTLRAAAYYNLGNSNLEPVFTGRVEGGRAEHLSRAIVSYKRALLIDSNDEDAKWNLELARRLLEEEKRSPRPNPSPGGGTGGGGGGDRREGQDNPSPRPASGGGDSPSLSQAAAERILQAAENRELGVQRAKLRKAQPPSPTAH